MSDCKFFYLLDPKTNNITSNPYYNFILTWYLLRMQFILKVGIPCGLYQGQKALVMKF